MELSTEPDSSHGRFFFFFFFFLSFLSLIKNYSRAFEQNSGSITASSKTSISAENIVIIFDFFLFESLKYFLQEDDGFMELR